MRTAPYVRSRVQAYLTDCNGLCPIVLKSCCVKFQVQFTLILFVCVSTCIYLCAPCICLVPTEVRRTYQILLKMELQGIVRGYVTAGKNTQVHSKSSKYSEPEPSLQPLHQTSNQSLSACLITCGRRNGKSSDLVRSPGRSLSSCPTGQLSRHSLPRYHQHFVLTLPVLSSYYLKLLGAFI